jgi:hypothetical protein
MVSPVPGHGISTPYGKRGSAWGAGWHDGSDFAAPAGTPIVAMWGGTVVHSAHPTPFGSAFGSAVVIDHDRLPDGSPGLWALYAHMSRRTVSVGSRVEAGQKIGEVGTTGNSTGNHCHVGVYRQPSWCSGCGVDPQPWIDAQPSANGSQWSSGDVYQAKLVPGQQDSDSVRRLQWVLNQWSFKGGVELPITGNYGPQTASEVAKFQTQVCGDAGDGAIGPKQTDALFAKGGPWRIIR